MFSMLSTKTHGIRHIRLQLRQQPFGNFAPVYWFANTIQFNLFTVNE